MDENPYKAPRFNLRTTVCLSLADFDVRRGSWIELTEDPQSSRSFWSSVLQFAVADNVDAVEYRLDAGDNCLALDVDGDLYPMVPPPDEYREQLLHAVQRLAWGGTLGAAIWQVQRLFQRGDYLGAILIEMQKGIVRWRVEYVASGVRLTRVKPKRSTSTNFAASVSEPAQ